jgi:hypothetical protein
VGAAESRTAEPSAQFSASTAMTAEPRSFDARLRFYDSQFVDGEVAFWDLPPDHELRRSYFCVPCRQTVAKDDLAAIFHHRQRGHRPVTDQVAVPAEGPTEQLSRALGEIFRSA